VAAPQPAAAAPASASQPISAATTAPVRRPLAPAPAAEPQPQAAASAAVAAPTPAPASDAPAIAAPAAPSAQAPAATPVADTAALAAALPEAPSRTDVVAGFQAIQPQLAQCAAGKHGVAKIAATIANSGRVASALIEGQFSGTPEGSCMARAVRGARFPQFSQPNLKITYPIAF
jgi:hypothetical protein